MEQVETEEVTEVRNSKESFFDTSENYHSFICVECGEQCKDKTHLSRG